MVHALKAALSQAPAQTESGQNDAVQNDAKRVVDDLGRHGIKKAWDDLAEMTPEQRRQVLDHLAKKDPNLEKYLVTAKISDPNDAGGFIEFGDVIKQTEAKANRLNFDANVGRQESLEALQKRASEVLGGTDSEQYKKFEKQLQDFAASAATRNLSDKEVANTYHQLTRLLSDKNDAPVSMENRIRLATDALKHATNYEDINQGAHKTCVENSLECRTYALYPSAAVRLLADVALTGALTTADGSKITMSENTIKPHEDPMGVSEHSYASQLFQMAAVNVFWQRQTTTQDGRKVEPGTIRYERVPYSSWLSSWFEDSDRDRLMDYSKNPPEPFIDPETGEAQVSPKIKNLVDVMNQITGHDETVEDITLNGVNRPQSETELKQVLERYQKKENGHGFPVQLSVDASVKPFAGDLNILPQFVLNKLGRQQHSIIITGYNPETGKVTVAGHDDDNHMEISVAELFSAMR